MVAATRLQTPNTVTPLLHLYDSPFNSLFFPRHFVIPFGIPYMTPLGPRGGAYGGGGRFKRGRHVYVCGWVQFAHLSELSPRTRSYGRGSSKPSPSEAIPGSTSGQNFELGRFPWSRTQSAPVPCFWVRWVPTHRLKTPVE